MRAVIQRVTKAQVAVADEIIGAIGPGLLVLLGVHKDDGEREVSWLVDKIVNLRIFDDEKGLLNRSLLDINGEMLIVSQFTLLGDCRKGRRPSWSLSAPPEQARQLYEDFIARVAHTGITTATGRFQAMMEESLVNSGPVPLVLESPPRPIPPGRSASP